MKDTNRSRLYNITWLHHELLYDLLYCTIDSLATTYTL